MPKFIPGLKLSELYYLQAVAPILKRRFPGLKYSAGLIGTGSEVLGYDTPRSTDHNWGLRLFIFLTYNDFRAKRDQIDSALRRELPLRFQGHPTSFGPPNEIGVRLPDYSRRRGPVNHYITFQTVEGFFGLRHIERICTAKWLGTPQQRLLEITSGRIFHDGLRVKPIIKMFQYYPKSIWLYMMALQWRKIGEEESFVARASSVGDDFGSRIIASRIVEELMELCFLMERRYAPYSKWMGTAFSELRIARKLKPVLSKVLKADSIDEREKYLSRAYHIVAEMHESLQVTKGIPTKVSKFWDRPYLVIHGDRFARELGNKIHHKDIRKLLFP